MPKLSEAQEKMIYILMVPGWDEGEDVSAERAFTNEAEAEAAAEAHCRGCAYIAEVPLSTSEVYEYRLKEKE